MEDNLIGDTNKLSSAWEGFILGLNKGEGTISNVFRGLVQWLTNVVNMFNMANKSYQELVDQAQSESLKNAIAEDAKEVAFLTEKLGSQERAVGLLVKQYENLKGEDKERNEFLDSQIFALNSLLNVNKEIIGTVEAETEATKKNTKAKRENYDLYGLGSKGITTFKVDNARKHELEITDDMKDQLAERLAANQAYLAQVEADEKASADMKKQIRQEFVNTVQSTGNILFDMAQANRQRELDSIGSEYEAKIAAAEGNNELQIKLAKELETEQNRLKREQAQSERNQALFNIAMSTGEGIARAVAFSPETFGLPFSAFVATVGALQTTAVLSKDLPGFFTGTESAPEGLAWVAEKGRELIENNGQFRLAEGKQITNLQGGEKIYNNRETEQMLNAAIYKDIAVNGNEGIENRLDSLIHAFKNQPREVTSFDDEGIRRSLINGNSSTHYLNRKGRK